MYKVRTGRIGLVEKRVSLAPVRDCERNFALNPSAYLNTLELIVTQRFADCNLNPRLQREAKERELEPGPGSTHCSHNAVRWSVDCDSRCYRLFVLLSRSLFEVFVNF